ncbi:hypothetical protein BCR35DRAFT_124708 [Leucosporidium creatinivorum]|uniref:Uncharacterized protein n=1 Tax=Leucosporidium creatinivorum TaxID=106004 RepID=A0A1Y2EWQ5_9BASI|nr:hypothetical protein BCR35DRAFT_124708 [Leucosporidium creatinivorum]
MSAGLLGCPTVPLWVASGAQASFAARAGAVLHVVSGDGHAMATANLDRLLFSFRASRRRHFAYRIEKLGGVTTSRRCLSEPELSGWQLRRL